MKPIVLLGALALTLAFAVGCAKKAEAKTAALAKTDSYPHTLSDVNMWYADPGTAKDAGPTYEKAFALLPPNFAAAETPAAATQCVRANPAALALLLEAAHFESCRYSADFTKGIETTLPHLGKVKAAAGLLNAAAQVHADAHDAKRAAQDVAATFALARSLSDEPASASQFRRVMILAQANRALQTVLCRVELPKEALDDLAKTVREMEEAETRGDLFIRGLIGERANAIALLNNPKKLLDLLNVPDLELTPDHRDKITTRAQSASKLAEEEQLYNGLFNDLLELRKQAFPARLKQDALVEQTASEPQFKKYPVLALLVAGLKNQAAKEAEAIARLRLAVAVLAVEQSRATTQTMPAELGQALIDPFNGQPLSYSSTANAFTLQTSGPKENLTLTVTSKR